LKEFCTRDTVCGTARNKKRFEESKANKTGSERGGCISWTKLGTP